MDQTTATAPEPAAMSPRGRRHLGLLLGIGLLACLGLASGGAWWLSRGEAPPLAQIGGPFTLVDKDGRAVTDRDLRGGWLLVYFGYTFCPDACPTTLTQVADALDRMGETGRRVRPVFISLDPKRDTPAVVGRYAAAFGPRLLGLTGSDAQVDAAARAYHVYHAVRGSGDDYTVDHSSLLFLMAPDGKFVSLIPADAGASEIAADLNRQLAEGRTPPS